MGTGVLTWAKEEGFLCDTNVTPQIERNPTLATGALGLQDNGPAGAYLSGRCWGERAAGTPGISVPLGLACTIAKRSLTVMGRSLDCDPGQTFSNPLVILHKNIVGTAWPVAPLQLLGSPYSRPIPSWPGGRPQHTLTVGGRGYIDG